MYRVVQNDDTDSMVQHVLRPNVYLETRQQLFIGEEANSTDRGSTSEFIGAFICFAIVTALLVAITGFMNHAQSMLK